MTSKHTQIRLAGRALSSLGPPRSERRVWRKRRAIQCDIRRWESPLLHNLRIELGHDMVVAIFRALRQCSCGEKQCRKGCHLAVSSLARVAPVLCDNASLSSSAMLFRDTVEDQLPMPVRHSKTTLRPLNGMPSAKGGVSIPTFLFRCRDASVGYHSSVILRIKTALLWMRILLGAKSGEQRYEVRVP